MADNTDEEHLDNSTNTQSVNPSDEIISPTDTDTITPIQEPEHMEVHHHPDLHHKPKKRKEYFLEFLMIFLAVTMGFIAENIREHFVDVRTEKEYLLSFKQQLLINKEQFTDIQNSSIDYKPALDSLANLFFSKNENKDLITTARLVVKSKMLNLKTIDVNAYLQLVNSGGLKYIHNVALKDGMTRYADETKAFEN